MILLGPKYEESPIYILSYIYPQTMVRSGGLNRRAPQPWDADMSTEQDCSCVYSTFGSIISAPLLAYSCL